MYKLNTRLPSNTSNVQVSSILQSALIPQSLKIQPMPPVDNLFPRTKRLLSNNEFELVFKKAEHRFREDSLQLIAMSQPNSNSRLGLVIPKKMLKKAVHRNRLKRLIRDEFRRWHSVQACDVIIVLKHKLPTEALYSPDLVHTIRLLFTRLDRYCVRNSQKDHS